MHLLLLNVRIIVTLEYVYQKMDIYKIAINMSGLVERAALH